MQKLLHKRQQTFFLLSGSKRSSVDAVVSNRYTRSVGDVTLKFQIFLKNYQGLDIEIVNVSRLSHTAVKMPIKLIFSIIPI